MLRNIYRVLNDVRQSVAAVCCFCIRLFGTNSVRVVPYGIMRNLDAIIRVSNYVRLNPGLQRARSLWSGVSENLIMHVFPAEREFMQPS